MKNKVILILTTLFFFSALPAVHAHNYATTFLFGGTNAQYESLLLKTQGVLNNVSPDYFEINLDGSLKIRKLDDAFVSSVQSKGITVTPFLSNHWDRELGIMALDNSEALSTQIAKAVNDHHLDGLNVDIENVTHLQRDAYTNFIRLLRLKMPNKIISVAVAANPNNWQTGWHGSYDYTKMATYCDYLVIMGYDESFLGSPAGPVASGNFTEKSIQYALTKTTANKLVLALPFYGRYWKEGAAVGGRGITNMDVENMLKNYNATKSYFSDKQSAKVNLTLATTDTMPKIWGGAVLSPGNYEIWYDDIDSTNYKFDLIAKYNLFGSGSWAIGQEGSTLWSNYVNYKFIPVNGVKMSLSATSIVLGKTKQLTATVSPTNAKNKAVTWTSSNPAIASVTSTGLVKGLRKGKAVITVRTNDRNKTATCTVTVIVPVIKVTMYPRTATVSIGKTRKLTATVYPTTASNKAITWTSSNRAVATVTSTGLVKGLRRGKATITVKTRDGSKIATCQVTVTR